jgi:hypothetical protein
MATAPKEKLYSMKRSAADKRKDMGETAGIGSIAPDYPYGLVIHLDMDEMDKLKMAMPKPGDIMTIEAKVKCTACRMSAVEGADEENSCDLQITDMMIEAPGD